MFIFTKIRDWITWFPYNPKHFKLGATDFINVKFECAITNLNSQSWGSPLILFESAHGPKEDEMAFKQIKNRIEIDYYDKEASGDGKDIYCCCICDGEVRAVIGEGRSIEAARNAGLKKLQKLVQKMRNGEMGEVK